MSQPFLRHGTCKSKEPCWSMPNSLSKPLGRGPVRIRGKKHRGFGPCGMVVPDPVRFPCHGTCPSKHSDRYWLGWLSYLQDVLRVNLKERCHNLAENMDHRRENPHDSHCFRSWCKVKHFPKNTWHHMYLEELA